MELHDLDDTIAAISTPPGYAGIGIVRMSGPEALRIAGEVFRPADRVASPSDMRTFSTRYGWVMDGDEMVDEVILSVMRTPRTYTTQDIVEINCHGGMAPVRRTLQLVLSRGARLADPGEFTKRAFAFGRIDLAQAEAVLDLINARTERARRAAAEQLSGGLSREITNLRDQLVNLMAHLEAALDFGDEDLGQMPLAAVAEALGGVEDVLQGLLRTAEAGIAVRDGVRTAISGRPNVGKSSLMNALLGHDRVIVTEVPGTTRDVVEHVLDIQGVPFILADTAGLRDTGDVVEAAGVERARAVLESADLVLLVLDGSEPMGEADCELLASAPEGRTVLVINKDDLPAGVEEAALAQWRERPAMRVSARDGSGIEELKDLLGELVWCGSAGPGEGSLVTNARHKGALEQALHHVQAAQGAVRTGRTEEYVASDLREALDALGGIVGETLAQDIINRVFETFCVGK